MASRAVQLDLYQTAIPMRPFEHAATARNVTEAVLVRLRLDNGGEGWGETLPRPYVTGETIESVLEDIEEVFWAALRSGSGVPPMEQAASRPVTAARAAVELAWQDACARSAGRPLGGPIPPAVRVSGVLGSADPARTARHLWLMRLFGLRDFKLKLGLGEQIDRENTSVVHSRLAKALGSGKCTLRVDVNGGWELAEAAQRIEQLAQLGVCAVEQPVSAPAGRLAGLAQRCPLPLIADESLITSADFNELVRAGKGRVWLNIRIAKNGGLDSALAMARAAAAAGVPFIVGCMVGETAILSAAQRVLLGRCPPPRFVEGNYGRSLLSDDLARKSPRFGYGGRLKALPGAGLGVVVDPKRLAKYGKLIKTLRD